MWLWHEKLIRYISNQNLKVQHSDCCKMRGFWWGRGREDIRYVWANGPYKLYRYHKLVLDELDKRGFRVDSRWRTPYYRGKCTRWNSYDIKISVIRSDLIYSEHTDEFYAKCFKRLSKI